MQYLFNMTALRRVTKQDEQMAGRFKRAQQLRGLTVRALAEKAHVTPPTVMRVRNGGGADMDAGLLADLARALDVSPGWLVYGEGSPPDGL